MIRSFLQRYINRVYPPYHGGIDLGKKELPKPASTPFEKGRGYSSKATSGEFLRGYARGSALIKEGKYKEAENILMETAEKFKDDNFLAVLTLADTLFFQQRYEEAEELYRACVEHMPIMAHCYHGLTLALRKNGKLEEAKATEAMAKKLSELSLGAKVPEYLPPL
jgi:tetratricopeptide (TPR) repeat protein